MPVLKDSGEETSLTDTKITKWKLGDTIYGTGNGIYRLLRFLYYYESTTSLSQDKLKVCYVALFSV
jgi:hypothetical protein